MPDIDDAESMGEICDLAQRRRPDLRPPNVGVKARAPTVLGQKRMIPRTTTAPRVVPLAGLSGASSSRGLSHPNLGADPIDPLVQSGERLEERPLEEGRMIGLPVVMSDVSFWIPAGAPHPLQASGDER